MKPIRNEFSYLDSWMVSACLVNPYNYLPGQSPSGLGLLIEWDMQEML